MKSLKLSGKSIPFSFLFIFILLGNISLKAQVIEVISQNNCSTFLTSEVHILDDISGDLFSTLNPNGDFTFILSNSDASFTQSNNDGIFTEIPNGLNYFVIVHGVQL